MTEGLRDRVPPGEVWLGIETSTPYLCLALWSPSAGLVARTVEHVERRHAVRVVGALEEMLAEAGIDRSALSAVAVGNGPGSYTGLRVGGATAKGLSRALEIPLAGCDTLAAIAFGALEDGGEALVGLDARRGNAYLGRYRREGEQVITVEGPQKVALEQARSAHLGLELIIDSPPDPEYVARQAASESPYRPLYL